MKKPFLGNDALSKIRRTANWQKLFQVLNLEKDEKKSKTNDWWAKSPFTNGERTASFHLSDKGFYCFSSNESGGVIELVQKVFRYRTGHVLNCFEAGQWLIDQGISPLPSSQITTSSTKTKPECGEEKRRSKRTENLPIRQSLLPALTFNHPEFDRRGLTAATANYLGFGYLPPKKSRNRLAGRIVFQVRGIRDDGKNDIKPVILTHMGRATSANQEENEGKWLHYAGFLKSLELYNLDNVLLDRKVAVWAKQTGRILVVEGCWDVAKLVESGVCPNVVGLFGSHLTESQIQRFQLISKHLGIRKFRLLLDRDRAGKTGQSKAIATLQKAGFEADGFDWEQSLPSSARGSVTIPKTIKDVCDFRVDQIRWLRTQGLI
jgi:hypothetical protein